MDIFETLISVYSGSDEKILLTDTDLNTVWKSFPELPDRIDISRIRLYYKRDAVLPFTKSETCEYKGGFGGSSALKIQPLRENDEIVGYLFHLYTCEDIELISDRSGHLKYKANFLGNIRVEMAQLINLLDCRLADTSENENSLDFDRQARNAVMKTFSATVNYNELSRYYSGFFDVSFINISTIVQEVCEQISEHMKKENVSFETDIEPMIYLDMNAQRLKLALSNLIVNSVKYNSKDDKRCKVSLHRVDKTIEITVEDNGDGIDSETAERAKKPFGCFKEYDRREFLGIAVANKCCEFFGGKLDISSEKGEFTCAKMIFSESDKKVPDVFRSNPFPIPPNPYDDINSIFSKAFDI